MRLADLRIERDLADDVGKGIGDVIDRGARIDLARPKSCRQLHAAANVLIGVFDRDRSRHHVTELHRRPELHGASPGDAHLKIRIDHLADEHVRGLRRQPVAIRRHQAPRLAGEKRERSLPELSPEHAHADGVGVGGDAESVRRVAKEVQLEARLQIRRAELAGGLQGDARVLRRELRVFHVALHRIAERDGAERGAKTAARIRRPPDRRGVDETAEQQVRIADVNGERRGGLSRGIRRHGRLRRSSNAKAHQDGDERTARCIPVKARAHVDPLSIRTPILRPAGDAPKSRAEDSASVVRCAPESPFPR